MLDNKLSEKIVEVKVETLVTLLSEQKAKALIDTLANRPKDVEIDTWRTRNPKIRRGAY